MDLTSLPDEIIANVLKYSDYVMTTTLRKINVHVNNVAKAYEIGTRLPVQKMRFLPFNRPLNDESIYWDCEMDIEHFILRYIKCLPKQGRNTCGVTQKYRTKDVTHLYVVNIIISKIEFKLGSSLELNCPFDIDDRLLNCLMNNQKSPRNLNSIKILSSFTCSVNTFREFINASNKLRKIYFYDTRGDMDVVFHSGILENRWWDEIQLFSKFDLPFSRQKLNDGFLVKVVKKCKTFRLSAENSFTIHGIIEFIKVCIIEDVTRQSIRLGNIDCEAALFEKVAKRLTESVVGLYIQWTFTNPDRSKMCKIAFSEESMISFTLSDNGIDQD